MSTVTTTKPAVRPAADSRPAGGKAPSSAATIDPIRVLRRYFLGIIGAGMFGGVVGLVAFVLLSRLYPLYTGEVMFEVRPGIQNSSDFGVNDFTSEDLVNRLCRTHAILLVSREVLSAAMNNPDIKNSTEWHKKFLGEDGVFDKESAIDELEEDLRTPLIRGSNYFSLKWSTHQSGDVPTVLNAVSRAYIDRVKELDTAIYSDNISVFNSQVAQSRRELEVLTRDMKTFIREKGLTTLDDSRYSTAARAYQTLSEQITLTTADLTRAESAYAQTAAKLMGEIAPTHEDLLMAENDMAVMAHYQQLVTLRAEQRRLREVYVSDHPQINRMEQRIRGIEDEIASKTKEITRRNLGARLKQLSDSVEQSRATLEKLDEESIAQEAMLQDLAAEQSEFEAMEARREYLEATLDSDMQLIKEVKLMRLRADAFRVREAVPAIVPRQVSFPKIYILVPLGGLLFAGAFVGIVFLRELTDQRVKSASDVGILPGARVLGVIPELSEDPTNCEAAELVVTRHPNSVLAESYRQSFTLMLRASQRAGHQTILLLGGLPGAGTTTAASNLAAAAAASGRRILLIDANFRRPGLARCMGLEPDGPGLGDVLLGEAAAADVIQTTEDGIDVLTAGTPAHRIFERLNTARFDSVLAELRNSYDLLMIDAPPAVVAGDAMVLASKVDASVLVIRAHQEHRGLVARLIRNLADVHSDPLGILLNRPRGTAGGYFKKNYAAMAGYGTANAE